MYLLALALLCSLAAFAVVARSRHQWEILSSRFRLQRRSTSNAETPPRSLSPEKKTTLAGSSPADYSDCFPPSRRHAISEESSSEGQVVSENPKQWSMSPFEAEFWEVDEWKRTATGFSMTEIKALGNFPDYAKLSGVPLPKAYPDFDIETARPRPYRPYRWAYHQTMSLFRLEPDWWIELESSYRDRVAQRKQLYERHGSDVLQWLPGTELACKELMEMVLQFLVARYPQYFSLSDDKRVFTNGILNLTSDIRAKHPLLILLDHVPEDFAIMLRHPVTGYYSFRAGIICSALGWNVGSKIGLRLHEIHAPIPDYKEKMQFSMDRHFAKMPTDRPIQRGSWGLEVDTPLYMPPGDPHETHRTSQDPTLELSRCHLRVDWQTLRRLPLSAAVVFNFKALFTPVEEFRNEPFIPALVAKVLREGRRPLMEYKNTWHVEHVCLPAMEKWAREQVERGVVPERWEVQTLEETPFFPGWEDKWRRQQGF